MVLITESFDSLPCKLSPNKLHPHHNWTAHTDYHSDIDAEPSAADRAAAEALIKSELESELSQPSTIHPLLPPSSDFSSPLLLELLERIETSSNQDKPAKINAVDLSRYEAVDAPAPNASLEDIKSAVEKSAISSVYLAHRQQKLEKLNESGKEEWLAGNEAVSAVLGGLEKELASTKEQIDIIAHERQTAQTNVQGEMEGYERTWRGGVEGVLRTEVAAETLRAQILEQRRMGN